MGVLAVVVAAVGGCGGGDMSMQGDACPQVTGSFKARLDLQQASGKCSQAKSSSTDDMQFNAKGYVSPLGDLARCSTTQVECSIDVACSASVVDVRLDFTGTLSKDGTRLAGTAVLAGSYDDCTRLVYAVYAVAE